jgi:5-carboxymethyl-2-hydroxymuconate isomerase
MPHLILQHSSNISLERMQHVCDVLHQVMVDETIFPLGGIRVRAVPCEAFAIADRHPENAFVDMVLRMARGRTSEQKKAAGQKIMAAAEALFAKELASPHFALSLEILEIDDVFSWKTNSIHNRLKKKP